MSYQWHAHTAFSNHSLLSSGHGYTTTKVSCNKNRIAGLMAGFLRRETLQTRDQSQGRRSFSDDNLQAAVIRDWRCGSLLPGSVIPRRSTGNARQASRK